MTAAALLLCSAALAPPGEAGNWPRFRGPAGDGTAPASANPPAVWDGETGENVLWHTPLPGPGSSSPVVWGGAVFLTCYTGAGGGDAFSPGGDESSANPLTFHLLRLSRDTGEVVWEKKVPATTPEDPYRGFIGEHGYATSTPCTDGERVYCFFGKTGVVAFDFDGAELWRSVLGTESGPRGWGSGSSPVLYDVSDGDGGTRPLLFVNACEQAQASRPTCRGSRLTPSRCGSSPTRSGGTATWTARLYAARSESNSR